MTFFDDKKLHNFERIFSKPYILYLTKLRVMCQTDLRRFSAKFKLVVNGLFRIIFKKRTVCNAQMRRQREKKEREIDE